MAQRMKLLSALPLALGLLLPGTAHAAAQTGAQLYAMCTANMGGNGNPLLAAECMGYIIGVADTFDCVEKNHGFTWNARSKINQPELVTVVLQWIDAHKESRSEEAHKVIGAALQNQYPCK